MLQYLHSPENHAGDVTDITVLESQRARWLWLQQQQSYQQQQQQQQNDVIQNEFYQTPQFHGLINNDFDNLMTPRTDFVRDKMGFASNPLEMENFISRTYSCPPAAVTAAAAATTSVAVVEEKGGGSALMDKMGSSTSTTVRAILKKRKAEFGEAEECKDKRIKADAEEVQSKGTEKSSRETSSADTSKENSKASEVQKPDYIHVRARRGQATDSHSLAERARREKIGKKMKSLQDLVPGCNKITGKAGMLDEIINYVQSLQRQVEFLSMKLAALNPRLGFNFDNFFAKEFPAHVASFPTAVASSSEMAPNLACLQFSPMQQGATSCGLNLQINPPQATQRTTSSSSVPIPETYLHSSCFPQVQPFSTLDTDLQTLYNVGFH